MRTINLFTAALLSLSACEAEPFDIDASAGYGTSGEMGDEGDDNTDGVIAVDDDRPVSVGGNAADDIPGCETLEAFQANRYIFGDKPAWWAFDFSGCGPNPEPRLLVWETLDGYVCEQEFDPIGAACEFVIMEDCPKVAEDGWNMALWTKGEDSISINYESVVPFVEEDYTPDSIIPCKAQVSWGETFWDCTGLPAQLPTCDPITVG